MNKVYIGITSYNRFDKLKNLLNQLHEQKTIHDFNIIISDDCSTDKRYFDIIKYFPMVSVIRTSENNGKKKYWKTINNILNYIKNKKFDYFIQIDDDFKLCENFLDRTINLFINEIHKNDKTSAMSIHLNKNTDLIESRWGLGTSWVDGGAIYTKKSLNELKFIIKKIDPNRWDNNSDLSSGVWHQVSNRLNKMGLLIIKPSYSLVFHNDENISFMNENLRKKFNINTYNFIDKPKK